MASTSTYSPTGPGSSDSHRTSSVTSFVPAVSKLAGGARVLGAVLTKFSVKTAGYGYGYEQEIPAAYLFKMLYDGTPRRPDRTRW